MWLSTICDVINAPLESQRLATVKVQLFVWEKSMRFLKIWSRNKFLRFMFMLFCQSYLYYSASGADDVIL